ncbi:TraR/DksA C4-type zinc finger protein [Shewanella fidelis]|uniref:DksA C4-type domain-containing protein n=1 Tax=Shewanella fidelis TaxID=173509 RepID=A0AAW8NNE4_9GAMM|nr:hypothetical protein [Shewanella fidelis]MDR8523458.1 hypothetical protein [Shewanella fidelis]MDW4813309.1 hypothetical protein [Shewanella fidelis]MDW4817320.1 hypothetical protein [Shewanella fidelis]MDW4821324.1 hypothetical protein [Shewanella fidelis]MDW4824598.1 hypothetical protein [Shewanella fidelis]
MRAVDWASELEIRERASCIARARKPLIQGNGICVDCLEAVEPKRYRRQRCLSCQQDEELRQRQRTGGRRG